MAADRLRATCVLLVIGLASSMFLGVVAPAGAQASAGPAVSHQVTPATTSVATFVGAAVLPGTGATRTAVVTSMANFMAVASQPSPALFLAANAYYENGGGDLWIIGTTDESPLTLVTAMDGQVTGTPPYQGGDTWVVPSLGSLSGSDFDRVAAALVMLAYRNTGLALLEPPQAVVDQVVAADDVAPFVTLADHIRSLVPSDRWPSAALYANRLTIAADAGLPFPEGTAIPLAAAIAGVIADTDVDRGVWISPGGTWANLVGVGAGTDAGDEATIAFSPTNAQMGQVNPAGVNNLLAVPGTGVVVWGARTLASPAAIAGTGDVYISTVRIGHFIRRSLEQSLGWAVFEPNGDALWATVEIEVTPFLHQLWIEGAFIGATAALAFTLQVDGSTTTPADVAAGHLNLVIGYAAVYPGQFVPMVVQVPAAVP